MLFVVSFNVFCARYESDQLEETFLFLETEIIKLMFNSICVSSDSSCDAAEINMARCGAAVTAVEVTVSLWIVGG